LFLPDGDGVNMRKPAAATVPPATAAVPAASPDRASVRLVCLALTLALLVLAYRIASVW
jgi:hypothetical protein